MDPPSGARNSVFMIRSTSSIERACPCATFWLVM